VPGARFWKRLAKKFFHQVGNECSERRNEVLQLRTQLLQQTTEISRLYKVNKELNEVLDESRARMRTLCAENEENALNLREMRGVVNNAPARADDVKSVDSGEDCELNLVERVRKLEAEKRALVIGRERFLAEKAVYLQKIEELTRETADLSRELGSLPAEKPDSGFSPAAVSPPFALESSVSPSFLRQPQKLLPPPPIPEPTTAASSSPSKERRTNRESSSGGQQREK